MKRTALAFFLMVTMWCCGDFIFDGKNDIWLASMGQLGGALKPSDEDQILQWLYDYDGDFIDQLSPLIVDEPECADVFVLDFASGGTITASQVASTNVLTHEGTAILTANDGSITVGAGTVSGISIDGVMTYPVEGGASTNELIDVSGGGHTATFTGGTWSTADGIPAYNLEHGFTGAVASDGSTQYINICKCITENSRITGKFYANSAGGSPFGVFNGGSERCYIEANSGTSYVGFLGSTITLTDVSLVGFPVEFDISRDGVVINGTNLTGELSLTVTEIDADIYIMARNRADISDVDNYLDGRVSDVKIFDDYTSDEAAYDIVPIYDPTNGAGFYDKVSKTFYYNDSTGTLTFQTSPALLEGQKTVQTYTADGDADSWTVSGLTGGEDITCDSFNEAWEGNPDDRYTSFDGGDDWLDLTGLMAEQTDVSNVAMRFVVETSDTATMFIAGGSPYVGAMQFSNAGSPDSGGGSPSYTVNGALLASPTRDDLYDAIVTGGSAELKIAGIDMSTWTELSVFRYAALAIWFLDGRSYKIEIDWTSDGTWDHVIAPNLSGGMIDTVTGTVFTNSGTGKLTQGVDGYEIAYPYTDTADTIDFTAGYVSGKVYVDGVELTDLDDVVGKTSSTLESVHPTLTTISLTTGAGGLDANWAGAIVSDSDKAIRRDAEDYLELAVSGTSTLGGGVHNGCEVAIKQTDADYTIFGGESLYGDGSTSWTNVYWTDFLQHTSGNQGLWLKYIEDTEGTLNSCIIGEAVQYDVDYVPPTPAKERRNVRYFEQGDCGAGTIDPLYDSNGELVYDSEGEVVYTQPE